MAEKEPVNLEQSTHNEWEVSRSLSEKTRTRHDVVSNALVPCLATNAFRLSRKFVLGHVTLQMSLL